MIVRDAAELVLVGAVLGLMGALALTPLLRPFLFQVVPNDPVTLGVVTLLLVAVALLAAWIPARRAARVDPLVVLRTE
jgi:ABC-type antimicrobial peptide transport system permease subunit